MKKLLHTSFLLYFCFLLTTNQVSANEYPVPILEDGKYGYQLTVEVPIETDKDDEDDVEDDKDIEMEEVTQMVIPAIYMTAEAFDEETGLALVSADIAGNGWPYEHGYIDSEGNEIIPLEYQQLTDFVEGFALAQKDGLYGYLTADGAIAVDFIYTEASTFSGGKAVVKLDGEMQIIDRPNWVASSIGLQEADYIMFKSTGEYMLYFTGLLENSVSEDLNDSDYVEMEKFLANFMSKMTALNAQVNGDKILILSSNYSSILESSMGIYDKFQELFKTYKIEPTETMNNYLNLMEQGIARVTYEGTEIPTKGDIEYTITPFPIPYFDENTYKSYSTNAQFSDYLSNQLAAMGDNDANLSGAESLMNFINYIYLNLEPLYISTGFNKVEIGTEDQVSFFKDAFELTGQINSILAQYTMKLQENASNSVVILVNGNNLNRTVKFQINKANLVNYLGILDGIRVIIGNQGQGVYLPSAELLHIFETRDTLYFEFDYSSTSATQTVHVTLFDADGKTEVTEIPSSIFPIMPVSSNTMTVYSFIEGQNTENWGGIIKLNNTIEFGTTFTGEYIVRETMLAIDDIGDLTVETQEKINFMASQGFFSLTGSNFEPDRTITRTELVTALVKMFFMQDTTATSNFKDVPTTSADYAMISAAYQAGIATGYEDNSFRGANFSTREEIVTFVARTLATRKGYTLTEDPLETIQSFNDYETFSEWSIEYIALAIEHNLISASSNFNGSEEVTRREAATLLYTLFFKLYDSSDTNVNFYSIDEGIGYPIFFIAFAVIVIILGVIASKIKSKIESEKRFKQRMERITNTIAEDMNYTEEDRND